MVRRVALAFAALAAACEPTSPCLTPETVLADGVVCQDARELGRFGELLAGRALTQIQRRNIEIGFAAWAKDAPADLRATLEAAKRWRDEVRATPPMTQARTRAAEVWRLDRGEGVLAQAPDTVRAPIRDAIAVWTRRDDEQVALGEMDIEGWIRLASLCREVQGATPLRLSIADRVAVYKTVRDRFDGGDEAVRSALLAVGPFWGSIRDRWQAADYEVQQAWIHAAPLPAPMTGTSMDYFQAVVAGDVVGLVGTLHERVGPFELAQR